MFSNPSRRRIAMRRYPGHRPPEQLRRGLLGSMVGRGVLLLALILAAFTYALAVGQATALAACDENGSLFWDDHTAGFGSTGTRQTLVVRTHSNVGAGCETNGIVAGGTSHMSPNNGVGVLSRRVGATIPTRVETTTSVSSPKAAFSPAATSASIHLVARRRGRA